MPVSPNNLQFSLSSEYLERLKEKANPGESLGLTAKRLLIEFLKGDRSPNSQPPSPDLTELVDRISDVEGKVTAIEVAIDCEHFPVPTVTERLTVLGEKLDQTIRAIAERHEQLEGRINSLASQVEGQATSPVKRPASPPPPPPRRKR
ncbi:hypothetical protein V0288_09270 [Pannus brasiliensis CCIBt3594]|uniref:Uncharacterized protein n=1 Tax=Pannus brasiliensis CCIBt3594 TaxID=1427578 RepID=A0AAW9QJM7_9CHRO